jgi:hypothetical protein
VRQYRIWEATWRWVQWKLEQQAAALPLGSQTPSWWSSSLQQVCAQLASIQPPDEGTTVYFSDDFTLLPFSSDPLPASPEDCLHWCPFDTDPADATADLQMTNEEFNDAVAGVQSWIDYLIEGPDVAGEDGG